VRALAARTRTRGAEKGVKTATRAQEYLELWAEIPDLCALRREVDRVGADRSSREPAALADALTLDRPCGTPGRHGTAKSSASMRPTGLREARLHQRFCSDPLDNQVVSVCRRRPIFGSARLELVDLVQKYVCLRLCITATGFYDRRKKISLLFIVHPGRR